MKLEINIKEDDIDNFSPDAKHELVRQLTKIGNNIRKIRESSGMTQSDLAAALQLMGCDITRSALAKIEVGQRHLYPDEIILIRKALNTTYDNILDI